jgi:hypothetical protein
VPVISWNGTFENFEFGVRQGESARAVERQASLMCGGPMWLVIVLVGVMGVSGCGGGEPQDSPANVVSALYERVADGKFEQACELFTDEVLDAISANGLDCQTSLAAQYPVDKREDVRDVEVDEDAIEINGDTATVPASAVTFGNEPSSGADTQVVQRDGNWWISVGP